MPLIKPITDLRKTTEISDICHSKKEPIFITKNGYGDMVIMSMETYEEMLEDRATDEAIRAAEAEYNTDGVLLDAKDELMKLRQKYSRGVTFRYPHPRSQKVTVYFSTMTFHLSDAL